MNRRRLLGIAVMTLVVGALAGPAVASTPGSRTVRIQLTFNVDTAQETFVASGSGVCTGGTADEQDILFIDGTDGFKIRMTKRLVCDDESGWFRIFLSVGQPGIGQSSGGWAIVEGVGDYERAVGGGTLTATGRYPFDPLGVDTMTGVIQP